MSDYDTPRLAELLTAGRGAVERARYVLMAITVAGGLILSAQFNLYYPWLRNKIVMAPTDDIEARTQQAIRESIYKDLQTVSVPILGIKFSAYDLSVMGSLAMLVLGIWFYYSLRRENHVVDRIYDVALEHDEHEQERSKYLYDSLVHHFVFNPLSDAAPVPTWGIRVMFFMPFWVPCVVALIDACSLFCQYKLGIPANQRILWWKGATETYDTEKLEGVWRCAHGLVVAGICWRIMYLCNMYHWNTRDTLARLRNAAGVVQKPDLRTPEWPRYDRFLVGAMLLLAVSFVGLAWCYNLSDARPGGPAKGGPEVRKEGADNLPGSEEGREKK
jgi:hypothetical protein